MLIVLLKRILIFFSVSLAICLLLSSRVFANVYSDVTFLDTETGFEISKLNNAQEINIPWQPEISVKVVPTKPTQKMRLETIDDNSKNACQFERIEGQANSLSTNSKYFVFSFDPQKSATSCSVRVIGWKSPVNWLRKTDFKIKFADNLALEDSNKSTLIENIYQITTGTNQKSEMELGSVTKRSAHGVRIYCTVSHFSYDDPIIFPNKPGLSHLHMFVGNTSAKASSTPANLLQFGNSSCEGGTNVRSSYWTPAVFNQNNEVVLPEKEFVYYKTFSGSKSAYDKLQIIPNGLEMLANKSTLNAKEKNFINKYVTKRGKEFLLIDIFFPNCIATDNNQWNGNPILSYQDMPGELSNRINSHVAYSGGPNRNFVGCPASHPYRTPTMSLKLFYDRANLTNGWYLASDIDKTKPGSTLHADYVAAWDPESMKKISQCNRESRSCDFAGGRRQLSDRFYDSDGKQIYIHSTALNSDLDRTPFGDRLKPNLN